MLRYCLHVVNIKTGKQIACSAILVITKHKRLGKAKFSHLFFSKIKRLFNNQNLQSYFTETCVTCSDQRYFKTSKSKIQTDTGS